MAVTVRGVLTGGLLPGPSPGIALAANVPAYGAVHGSAGVLFLPEQKDPTGDFAFGLTFAWIGPCFEPLRGSRGALSACAKLDLGAIHSVVYKLDPTAPGDRFWAAGSLSAEGRLRLVGPLVAEAGLELLVPITQEGFSIQEGKKTASIYQEWAAGLAGFLGLGVSIP